MYIPRWLSLALCHPNIGAFHSEYCGNLLRPNEKMLGATMIDSSSTVEPKNFAAVLSSEKAELEVLEVAFPRCGEDELIIKNYAAAINPIDWKIQAGGFDVDYPMVLGEDIAGEVVAVGSNVKHSFRVGQRVIAHTSGWGTGTAYGGFQSYPLVGATTASLIPDDMSFVDAAVLPLSISTAAAGLFMNATLGLNYPKTDSTHPLKTAQKNDPILLVWGGSSSVGSSVIQLASAAGYVVITTASSSNFDYCKDLGAAHVVDYHDSEVASKLISLMKGKTVVGAYDSIGSDTTERECAAVLNAVGGGVVASVGLALHDLFPDVKATSISSSDIVTEEPKVAKAIWGTYVPWALKSGLLVPSPKALITGSGLAAVQDGLDRLKKGVSASKLVISDLDSESGKMEL